MPISVEVIVKSDLDSVWKKWNNPEDIKYWNAASDDWHTTFSEVNLIEGGSFLSRMEAKDGSVGFDFKGIYKNIKEPALIVYEIEGGREVRIEFAKVPGGVKVVETFEAETQHSEEQQKEGWQAILNNFAQYVENN